MCVSRLKKSYLPIEIVQQVAIFNKIKQPFTLKMRDVSMKSDQNPDFLKFKELEFKIDIFSQQRFRD